MKKNSQIPNKNIIRGGSVYEKKNIKVLFLIATIMFCVSSNTKVQAASDLLLKRVGRSTY